MANHSQYPGNSIKVFFVGNYLPRNCGIATFTYDLSHALEENIGKGSYRVVAINNVPDGYDYPEQVSFEINQNRIHDYRLAADYVNFSGVDVISLQHEFGIYGGAEGAYINHFLSNVKKPVITTLHTILKNPDSASAYRVTQDSHYLELAQAAFEWFLGRNRLGVSLYDFPRGACFDGIDPHGINQNQGAESIICFLLANLALSQKGMLKTLVKSPSAIDFALSPVPISLGKGG